MSNKEEYSCLERTGLIQTFAIDLPSMNDGVKEMLYLTPVDIPTANPRVERAVPHWTLCRSGRT